MSVRSSKTKRIAAALLERRRPFESRTQREVRITVAVLAIAGQPHAPFRIVWVIPGGFRVRASMHEPEEILSWRQAEELASAHGERAALQSSTESKKGKSKR
jgi:hypothetical protein